MVLDPNQWKNNHRTRIFTAYRPCRSPSQSSLTTTWDQQLRYIRIKGWNRDPPDQFDHDLRQLLEQWTEDDIKIVLSIDTNENIANGPISNIMKDINLINLHVLPNQPPISPTHDRGSVPISGMLASPSLVPSRVGILAHAQRILGDHHNMFVDFDEHILMGSELHSITPPQQRRLQLYDSRIVRRLNNVCFKHLRENKIPEKSVQLYNEATYPPPEDLPTQLESIDEQVGRAITSGHSTYRKFRNGSIPFSETFRKLRDERRLWLLVKKFEGLHRDRMFPPHYLSISQKYDIV